MSDYNTHIQIKRPDGVSIYPVVDLGYERNVGDLPGDYIADSSIPVSKLAESITIEKGGTGATTASAARTNLEVYSKNEVTDLISGLTGLSCVIVDALPDASADTLNKIYLIAHEHDAKDTYDEYLTIKSDDSYSWEKIGNTDVDLTDYSKKSHKHEFSGTAADISVSGSYSKAVGINIEAYTPEGNISLNRDSDVSLSTEAVKIIDEVGSLPSLTSESTGDIPYLKDISLNNTLGVSYNDPTFESKNIKNITDVGAASDLIINETVESGNAFISELTKENYTPEGSIDLGSNESVDGVKYIESVSGGDVSSTSTDGFITGIDGGSGSLSSSTTENEGDIPYLSAVTLKDTYSEGVLSLRTVPTQSYLHHEHNAASVSSTASAITSVSGGAITSSVKYLHPTFTGSSKNLVVDGAIKYIHFAKGNAPTVEEQSVLVEKTAEGNVSLTGNVGLNKSTEYLNFNAGSLPTTKEKTIATGISQQPTFTGIFNGTQTTLTGTITNESESITSTGNITPSGTITSAIE